MAKFATNASGAIWWPNLELMQVVAKYATNASGAMLLINLIQVTESISGSVVPLAMFCPNLPGPQFTWKWTNRKGKLNFRFKMLKVQISG